MKRIRAFALFWYEFVVGDDWRIAIGAIAGLALTALLVHVLDIPAWWALPVVVVVVLARSLWVASRSSTH